MQNYGSLQFHIFTNYDKLLTVTSVVVKCKESSLKFKKSLNCSNSTVSQNFPMNLKHLWNVSVCSNSW